MSNAPSTWEEALDNELALLTPSFQDVQPDIEKYNALIGQFYSDLTRNAEQTVATEHGTWVRLGVEAYQMLKFKFGPNAPTIENLRWLLISKQHDYGHGNILRFGLVGLIVRMSDKIARILNLEGKGAGAMNEPLKDSYSDILGYALIGMMLTAGTFTLELST